MEIGALTDVPGHSGIIVNFILRCACVSPPSTTTLAALKRGYLYNRPVWYSAVWTPLIKRVGTVNLLTPEVKWMVKTLFWKAHDVGDNCLRCTYFVGQNTIFIITPFTAGYFYAWMESVRPEDETPRLIKFILSRWYVLIEQEKENRAALLAF